MRKYDPRYVRNFSIIAHIDHGKSTLADRLLEFTGTISKREMQDQLLDDMELERERGITIKARPVTMYYNAKDGHTYQFNFIDTPGHVDFSYEVSRSLAAVEGALLIVDAAQGVQAQTLANVHLALDRNLEILPIINKIDLPAADPENVKKQIEDVIGLPADEAVLCSAKTGVGIESILEQIITHVPPPKIEDDPHLKALIFDSYYDTYRGVMVYVRVMNGEVKPRMKIQLLSTDKIFEVLEVGIFAPKETSTDSLKPGEVGYVIANIKNGADIKIGDTMISNKNPNKEPLSGFKMIKPVVFAGIYPVDSTDFENLKDALVKLQLNDSALAVEQQSSMALGFGFRCGFLGLLHLEIIFERLSREFNLDIITTSPSVSYNVHLSNGKIVLIDNSAHFPDPTTITLVEEPFVQAHIMTPHDFVGAIMGLVNEKRGHIEKTESIGSSRLLLTIDLPMNEVITDFNDKLKSVTKGYASFDYELSGYKPSKIVKLEIKVNDEVVDPFSCLVHFSKAEAKGRTLCHKLKEVIPRQQFKVPIQAAIGGKIVARETLSALSKNVTAKCYGGDITRKRKLWEKQKKGKKKMKEFGKVQIPQSAFMKVLKSEE
ncbi:elongation factor 4 [Candidatus Aerophobetes bacterium]|uniref:Elongation factor 4 n=1 Tax=Aerophobetes bacterium TaxID=2030807 RepID=A0A2A4X6W6_UNCAE|nr:MAG: elongation factor 4 [Candidatus Aerophobetes bacterium]